MIVDDFNSGETDDLDEKRIDEIRTSNADLLIDGSRLIIYKDKIGKGNFGIVFKATMKDENIKLASKTYVNQGKFR